MKKRIIPRKKHPISRQEINESALKVLYKLKKHGFQAYLVGGCIRDRLLGFAPKDFDVSTDARPEQVCKIFRNAIPIGRRFKIVHIRYGREIIEVTTFRKSNDLSDINDISETDYLDEEIQEFDELELDETNEYEANKQAKQIEQIKETREPRETKTQTLVADNSYGTSLEEDAQRRDFTINALYYNIKDFGIYDFFNGMQDLKNGRIRIIGDAEQRYTEDPVRMLRAIRFAAKLDFKLARDTKKYIKPLSHLILKVAPARMFDEVLKLFLKGQALKTLDLCLEFELYQKIFPSSFVAIETDKTLANFLRLGLENTDRRIANKMTVIPAFLYGVILWPSVKLRFDAYVQAGLAPSLAMQNAANEIVFEQNQIVRIPKRFSITTKEIWNMQWRLTKRPNKASKKLLDSPRFKASYDFLLLRQASGEQGLEEAIKYWQKNLEKQPNPTRNH